MKKKLLSLLLALAMVFTLAACGEKKPDPGKDATATEPVVILHTNDVHGAVSNYAKVAALASQYESEGAYVLILDAGDFSQGDTAVSVSEGATAVELMNMVGYDAVALGNHEFDYGFEALKKNMENAQFPVLAANVKYNGELAFDDAAVFTTPVRHQDRRVRPGHPGDRHQGPSRQDPGCDLCQRRGVVPDRAGYGEDAA